MIFVLRINTPYKDETYLYRYCFSPSPFRGGGNLFKNYIFCRLTEQTERIRDKICGTRDNHLSFLDLLSIHKEAKDNA